MVGAVPHPDAPGLSFGVDKVNPHELDSVIAEGAAWRELAWEPYLRQAKLANDTVINYVDVGASVASVASVDCVASVACVDWEPARTRPTLLLVHGLGGSWKVWMQNVLAFAHDHRVLVVDLPGFGGSPAPEGSCSYAAYAETLGALVHHLDLTEVVVAGNSFGGWVAAELARQHRDRVTGLVLIDAAGIVPTRRERFKVVTMMRNAGRMAPLGMRHRERILNSPRNRKRAFGFIIARADLLPPDVATFLMPDTPSPVFQKVIDEAVRNWSQDWCQQMSELDTPAVVIWGSEDRQLPLRHAQLWNRMLVDSELVVVPGAGHMPMLESPQLVNHAIRQLLQRLPS